MFLTTALKFLYLVSSKHLKWYTFRKMLLYVASRNQNFTLIPFPCCWLYMKMNSTSILIYHVKSEKSQICSYLYKFFSMYLFQHAWYFSCRQKWSMLGNTCWNHCCFYCYWDVHYNCCRKDEWRTFEMDRELMLRDDQF